ncbi:MAG: transcription termination factor NusA [Candidatus Kapabacteria bacterium]|nr:transcription termination factor NusA [Candidatus Kapabacteria bacterium]MDW8012936.1 transcription termination factor NusA [Bacteroidota bacterium]
MPRRRKQHTPDKQQIIAAFTEMARQKRVDRDILQGILEEVLRYMVQKKYGPNAQAEIIVNMDKGDIEIYVVRTVVETVEDPSTEIALEELEARGEEGYEVGDEYVEEIRLEDLPVVFGRRIVAWGMQRLAQRIREVERENIYTEYSSRVGEIIIGEIYQVRRGDVLVLHDKVEMRLPREEQIPGERYRKGATLRALIKEVRPTGGPGGMPDIILSRADDRFFKQLFELEIPEVYDGVVEIKAVAREPGERAKVAVISHDDRVDPVGACVGMKGIRIHAIVRELNNENIDVIEYSPDPATFIARALQPARVLSVEVHPETRSATVVVPNDQVALAVGRNGHNVRLASKLTGYAITLVKETPEDIELFEFREELGRELYERLIEAGIDTAREFLEADPEKLLRIPGMTKDLLLELRQLMLEEFDEQEDPAIRERILALELSTTLETVDSSPTLESASTTPTASEAASLAPQRRSILEVEDVREVFAEEQSRDYGGGRDEEGEDEEERYRLSDELPYSDSEDEHTA